MRLDIAMTFTANPEDYTARGKIVTPLKDRIGSEIRTHYPRTRHEAMAITEQEAWVVRGGAAEVAVPLYVREVVEEIAFQARTNKKIDGRSGVSQRMPITCLENVVSNAERRAIAAGEAPAARITDVYASLPAMTGKFELEYEGELRGADAVASEIIRAAVGAVFGGWFDGVDTHQVVEWFEMGGTLQESDTTSSEAFGRRRRTDPRPAGAGRARRRRSRGPAGADRLGRRLRAGGPVRPAQDQPAATAAATRRSRSRGRRLNRPNRSSTPGSRRRAGSRKKYYN